MGSVLGSAVGEEKERGNRDRRGRYEVSFMAGQRMNGLRLSWLS